MHPETIQLETLRQKIEDALYESAMKSEMLDRGKPGAAETKKTREYVNQLDSQAKALTEELQQTIAATRLQNLPAVEEWIDYHIGMLQKIVDEKSTEKNAAVRRNVAKGTIQEWEKVRASEQQYVNINWYFLKDYKAGVRSITGGVSKKADGTNHTKTEDKAWWQFWK